MDGRGRSEGYPQRQTQDGPTQDDNGDDERPLPDSSDSHGGRNDPVQDDGGDDGRGRLQESSRRTRRPSPTEDGNPSEEHQPPDAIHHHSHARRDSFTDPYASDEDIRRRRMQMANQQATMQRVSVQLGRRGEPPRTIALMDVIFQSPQQPQAIAAVLPLFTFLHLVFVDTVMALYGYQGDPPSARAVYVLYNASRRLLQMIHRDYPPNANQSTGNAEGPRILLLPMPTQTSEPPNDVQELTRERSRERSSTPGQRLFDAANRSRPTELPEGPHPDPDYLVLDAVASEAAEIANRHLFHRGANPGASASAIEHIVEQDRPFLSTRDQEFPHGGGRSQHDERMWIQFRYEYLRIELGLETSFTSVIRQWLRSVSMRAEIREL